MTDIILATGEQLTFTYDQVYSTEDETVGAGKTGTGVTIVNGTPVFGKVSPNLTGSGLALKINQEQFDIIANTSSGQNPSHGYVYTAIWAQGSTYATTPVEVWYDTSALFGNPCYTLWVIDPTDTTYKTGATGTYNFPVTIVNSPDIKGGPVPS